VATFTVEISGTLGVGFQGTLAPSNQSIEGQVPAQYTVVTAAAVGVAVTKAQVEGELTVRILRDGREVARRTTTAPYGNVTLLYTVH